MKEKEKARGGRKRKMWSENNKMIKREKRCWRRRSAQGRRARKGNNKTREKDRKEGNGGKRRMRRWKRKTIKGIKERKATRDGHEKRGKETKKDKKV